jgi:hypothetical protein
MTYNQTEILDVRELSTDEIDLVSGAADGTVTCSVDTTGQVKCTVTITIHF